MNISYIVNELAEDRENYYNAVAPPIMQSSNFAFADCEEMRSALADEYSTFLYSRGLNPTVDILRKKLAALDHAEDCLVFNSGVAAIFVAILANIKSGDHIISVSKPYTWAEKLFNVILPRFGVTTSFIDGCDIANFKRAILPSTTIIYLESPNSWDFALQDLKAVAELAKLNGILTIIDNSYCTSIYQKPIDLGIDIVLQSGTKYIGGHSDTLAGVLSGKRVMIERIFASEYNNIGSGISPFNAWLLIRGLRTLPMRIERITKSTFQILEYLKSHEKVERVIFPFDESFPQYALAKQQMKGACGLLTFIVKATKREQIENFCNRLQHILLAVSWGGYESLIVAKCVCMATADFDATNPAHRMIRMYVGLEEPAYLIEDLELGFSGI